MRSSFALLTASTVAMLLGAPYAQAQNGLPSAEESLEQRLQAVEAELHAIRRQQAEEVPPWAQPVRLPGVEHEAAYGGSSAYETLPPQCPSCPAPMSKPCCPSSTCGPAGCRYGAGGAASRFPSVTVSGFFQADAGLFYQSPLNLTTVGDIQDGADFRRARLLAKGDVYNNVGYMVEMDFAFPGRPSFMDVYMEGREIPLLGTFRLGQWRQPWGMDELTSVRELTFLERALPFAFAPFRQIGMGIMNHDPSESITWAASLIRFPTDVFGSNIGDDGGYSMVSRFTVLPWYIENYQVFHLGFDYAYINPANDAVQYRNQPEFFVGETGGGLVPTGVPTQVPFFVDTGAIPTVDSQLYGVEIAGSWGPVYAQSEVQYAMVNQINGPLLTFPGAYAQVGWFLTGESRAYNRTGAVFTRVQPNRNFGFSAGDGLGAWELAFRWSHLNLNDNNIQGGRLNDLTFGLNWYLNRYTKLQLNNIHAFLDNPTSGPSECNIVCTRAQIDF